MSKATHYMSDETLRDYARWLEIPAATLAGLRDGTLVAVPVEPTEAMLLAGSAGASCYGSPLTRTESAYRAMLAAAQEAGR